MSLRGSKTTEAISQGIENKEIATLPLVARNDEKGITTQPQGGGRVMGRGDVMGYWKIFLGGVILFFALTSFGLTEDYPLQYFMAKISSKSNELSKKERIELLNRLNGVVEQAQQIHTKLIQAIQTGEMDIRYQEGKFWMAKLEEDRESIEMGIQQLKLLREKPTHLIASIKLYKSLKDLSSNFNAYNNIPLFSALVGDLAPEMELWADPIFYKLYLLPLARLKDKEIGPSQKEKKPISKGKVP
jgi:hypothetical protein